MGHAHGEAATTVKGAGGMYVNDASGSMSGHNGQTVPWPQKAT